MKIITTWRKKFFRVPLRAKDVSMWRFHCCSLFYSASKQQHYSTHACLHYIPSVRAMCYYTHSSLYDYLFLLSAFLLRGRLPHACGMCEHKTKPWGCYVPHSHNMWVGKSCISLTLKQRQRCAKSLQCLPLIVEGVFPTSPVLLSITGSSYIFVIVLKEELL